MLDLLHGGVLHAGAEVVDRANFWWGPQRKEVVDQDLVARPLSAVGALHTAVASDYAGGWMCQVPLGAVRRLGAALPFFLKWDDAEYGLRAAAAGVPTVSLLGTAVWHRTWQQKDDDVEWPAYFLARNRVVTAMVHGGSSTPLRMLVASLLVDLKQLLALQYAAVELRHQALNDVRAGPELLSASLSTVLAHVRAVHHAGVTGRIVDTGSVAEVTIKHSAFRPADPPAGILLLLWSLRTLARQLLLPVARARTPLRLDAACSRWWMVAGFDSVLAPTADGTAHYWYVRDPRRLLGGLRRSLRVHGRLAREWEGLAERYRTAAPVLASLDAWSTRFADHELLPAAPP